VGWIIHKICFLVCQSDSNDNFIFKFFYLVKSLIMCSGASEDVFQELPVLAVWPVTPRNRMDANQEEAGDYWRDSWKLGKTALGVGRVGSPKPHFPRGGTLFWSYRSTHGSIPPGEPERGGEWEPQSDRPKVTD